MADQSQDVLIHIKALIEGGASIDELSTALTGLGVNTDATSVQAAHLSLELQRLNAQSAAIESFTKLEAETLAAGAALDELKAKTAAAEAAQAGYTASVAAGQSVLDAARASVAETAMAQNEARIAYKDSQAALVELRAQRALLRAETDRDKAAEETLTLAIAAQRETIAAARAELKSRTAALNEAAASEKTLQRLVDTDQASIERQAATIETLSASVKTSSAAYTEQAAALETARTALTGLGLSSDGLAAEQERVAASTLKARAAVADLVGGIEQEAVALGAIGPEADAVSAAFTKLNIRPFSQIRQDIAGVESALASLKASGTLSAEALAQAEAKAAQQTAALRAEMQATAATTDKASHSIGGLHTQFLELAAAYAGFEGIRVLQETADAAKEAAARLRLVTDSTDDYNAAQQRLFAISQETRSSFTDTVNFYARLANNTKDLKISQEDLLRVTDTLNKSIQLSGVGANEAKNGLIQLSQGLAAGTLRGQDLKAVLEDIPSVGQTLAKGLGVTMGQLRELAKEGALTPKEIIAALLKEGDEVDAKFSSLPTTIGGAMTQLGNNFLQFVGEVDKANGVSTKTVEIIQAIANNLQTVGTLAAGVGEIVLANLAVKGAAGALKFATELAGAAKEAGSLSAILTKMPTSLRVAIAVVGFELLKEAGEMIGEYAGKISDANAQAEATSQARQRQLQEEIDGLIKAGAQQSLMTKEYTLSAEEVGKLSAAEREQETSRLEGIKKQLLDTYSLLLREKELAEHRGQSTSEYDSDLKDIAGRIAAVRTETESLTSADVTGAAARQNAITEGSQKILDSFEKMIDKGKSTDQALSAIGKDFSASGIDGVQSFIEALGKLQDKGDITAKQFNDTFAKELNKLSTEDLVAFRVTASAAFDGASDKAGLLGQVLDKVRTAELAKLGLDAVTVMTGISKETRDATLLITDLGESSTTTAQVMQAAFNAALAKATTKEDAAAIGKSIEGVKIAGFDAAAAVKEIADRTKALPAAAESVSPLTQAYKDLGIVSAQALQDIATKAEQAYDALQNANVPVGVLDKAFSSMASKALDAAAAQGNVELQIAANALQAKVANDAEQQSLDELIKKYPELSGVIATETKKQTDSIASVSKAIDTVLEKMDKASDEAGGFGAGLADQTLLARQQFARVSPQAAADYDSVEANAQKMNQTIDGFIDTLNRGIKYLRNKYGIDDHGQLINPPTTPNPQPQFQTQTQQQTQQQPSQQHTYQVNLNIAGKNTPVNLVSQNDAAALIQALKDAKLVSVQ